jgi:hypothetical protein
MPGSTILAFLKFRIQVSLIPIVPPQPQSEPHEEIPGLFRDPVDAVLHNGVRMPSLEETEYHGIIRITLRKLGSDTGAAGCQWYVRRDGASVVFNML